MLQLIHTHDGSPTLYTDVWNETYHSKYGAIAESAHVYIHNGLSYYHTLHRTQPTIRIFEIGFGTGLNSFLSCQFALYQHTHIHYTAIEKYPLSEEIYTQLSYATRSHDKEIFFKLHFCPWNMGVSLNDYFSLHKISDDLTLYSTQDTFDIIYYDAFAPDKQPELWTNNIIAKISAMCHSGTVLVSYCCKGDFKRSLRKQGWNVHTIPGPPQGKREVLRAIKQ